MHHDKYTKTIHQKEKRIQDTYPYLKLISNYKTVSNLSIIHY